MSDTKGGAANELVELVLVFFEESDEDERDQPVSADGAAKGCYCSMLLVAV